MITLTIQNIVWIGICLIVLLVNKVSAHVPVDRPSLLIVGGAQNVTTQHTAAAAANNNNNNSNNRTTTPATNKSTTFKFSRRKNKYVRVDDTDKKNGTFKASSLIG
jgi:hypothetical protein